MEPDEVPASSMVAATRLMREYFWPHARAALRQIGLTDRHRGLRRVLRWIAANNRAAVSLKDIRREALGGALDAEQTRDLLDRAVAAGWLRLEKTEPAVGQGNDGGRIQKYSRLQKLQELQKVSSHLMFRAFLQFLQFLQFTKGGRDEAIPVH
jgi:hypothetical protein